MFKSVGFVLTVCFLNVVVAISDEQKAHIHSKFKSVGDICIKEHPLTDEDVTSFKNRKFPSGDNAGCFAACVLKNISFFDENGNLSKESALKHAKEVFEDGDELKGVEQFVDICAKVNDEAVEDGDKGCERAKHLFNCFTENLDKFNF